MEKKKVGILKMKPDFKFSLATPEARRCWNNAFKVLRENDFHPDFYAHPIPPPKASFRLACIEKISHTQVHVKRFKQNEGIGKQCLQFRRTERRATLSRLSKHRSRLSKEGYKRDIPRGKG